MPRRDSYATDVSDTTAGRRSRFNFLDKKDVDRAEKGASTPAADVPRTGDVMNDPLGKVSTSDVATVDAVWGEISADGPNYRSLGWFRASIIGIKSTIGIGVLGLPTVMNTMGWVPGILIIIATAMITTWTAVVIGKFKRKHPEIYTLADVGQLMLGPVGREVFGFFYWLHITAVAGSGLVSFATCLNAVTLHGACTVVFVIVGLVLGFVLSSIQTLDKISWIGWSGLVSIMAAIITVCIAVGVQDRPADAPATGPWSTDTAVVRNPGFIEGMNAVNTAVFAFSTTPYFFNIIGEMKDPNQFTKTACVTQTFVTATYLSISIVIYNYCGQYLASPALGSAGPLLKRIAYGIAIPGLLASIVMSTHMPAKFVMVRLLRGTKHLAKNTKTHYAVWYAVVLFNITISFLIAEAIPFFGLLLSLIGALLGSFICLIAESYMWMFDHWRPKRKTIGWALTFVVTALIHIIGWYVMVAGTYAAVVEINNALKAGDTTEPFSCADNSNSV